MHVAISTLPGQMSGSIARCRHAAAAVPGASSARRSSSSSRTHGRSSLLLGRASAWGLPGDMGRSADKGFAALKNLKLLRDGVEVSVYARGLLMVCPCSV
jgi:hypothetical protein